LDLVRAGSEGVKDTDSRQVMDDNRHNNNSHNNNNNNNNNSSEALEDKRGSLDLRRLSCL
jgi:hypothetical protein